MKNIRMWVLLISVIIVAFIFNPHGPLGGFWRPDPMSPTPTAIQLPFFILLSIFEWITFAFAVVLVITRFPHKPFMSLTLRQTRIAFLCLVWFLGNWWAHDSLHMHNGMNLQGLLYIEYGFHVTMMAAAAYLFVIVNKLIRHTKTSSSKLN